MYPVITAVLSPADGINHENSRSNAAVVTSVYIALIVPGIILVGVWVGTAVGTTVVKLQTPLSAQSLF